MNCETDFATPLPDSDKSMAALKCDTKQGTVMIVWLNPEPPADINVVFKLWRCLERFLVFVNQVVILIFGTTSADQDEECEPPTAFQLNIFQQIILNIFESSHKLVSGSYRLLL